MRKGKKQIIQNPELEKVLKGFVPTFGSETDLDLIARLDKLLGLLSRVDNEVLRGPGTEGGKATHTPKMIEILAIEKALIRAITNRNMDF